MKLCFIASASDNHTRKWIRYFAEKGYEIHWISLPSEFCRDFSGFDNVHFYIIPDYGFKFMNVIFNIRRVRKIIRKIKPDIIHSHYAGVNGALAAFSGFRPFILTAYGSDILIAPKSLLVRPIIRRVLKKADFITCDAEHMVKAMEKLGADKKKIKIIYFGVDTKKFSPGPKSEELAKKLSLEKSKIVISLRVLEPIYNVAALIKAAALISKEIPSAKFIIAGTGSEEKTLRELARALGVFEKIRFVGWISADKLPDYLRISDVYVSTSLSDAGIASSTAEAMSCGLASVVTDFGDNKDWIMNNKTGFLFEMKNEKDLAKKVIYLLKNESERKKMGDRARKLIQEKNDYCEEMEKMNEIYKKFYEKSVKKN